MASVDGFSIPHTVLRHFDLTSTPFTETFNRDVAERRRTYPDSAIFLDQLLSLASIDGPSSYPPTTPAALRRLIHTIRSAQIDRLKQDCFLYYLLLDYDHHASTLPNGHTEHLDEGTMDEDEPELAVVRLDKGKGKERAKVHERADGFARRRCLPLMWRGFIFGYWALDHGLWEDAVQALSDPAITSLNFLPSIFTLLSTHVSPPSRSLSLIHTLFTALGPPLDTERMVTLRTISLAHASLANAFNFIRVRPASERPKLREDIWLWALGAHRISLGQGPPSVQPSILTQLIHLPLIPEESAHLLQFLTHPPRSLQLQSLDLLHELITVRMIHQGQYAECLALDKELAGSQAGNQEDRQKRRERVKEFIAILPEAQRRVLEIDGEDRRGEVLQKGPIWDEGGDVDMPSTESRSNTAPIIAPAPTRLPTLLSLTNGHTSSHPSSPAIRNLTPKPSRNVSSPFSGPPQFARHVSQSISTPTRSSPVQRLVSGSPFQQPSPRGAVAVEVPRPSRRIIDDDDMDEESVLGKRRSTRSRQVSGRSRMSSTPVKPVQAPPSTTWDNEEHADKAVENDDEHDEPAQTQQNSQQDTTEMPPPPVPSSTRPRATRPAPKSAKKPSQPTPSLPPPSPTTSTATRSTRRQSTVPPESPGLGGPMPGSFTPSRTPTTAVQNGRARITRSASRAVLDEDNDQDPGPLPKKAKTSSGVKGKARGTSQAPSDMTEESGVRRSMRRGTREVSVASSTGGRSRRIGSPTPSVASTTRSGRQGSATPRAGRGKK